MRVEPHVDALGVKTMATLGEEPALLGLSELGQAHRALHLVISQRETVRIEEYKVNL